MSVEESKPVLAARHITRHFGAVVALADASLTLNKREVLGLVGDNGAGKSTLLKILSGVLSASSGEIFIDGRPVQLRRAQDAMDAGIETVYQDLALVDTMTAYQNVYLGREELSPNPLARFFNLLDDRRMRRRARAWRSARSPSSAELPAPGKGDADHPRPSWRWSQSQTRRQFFPSLTTRPAVGSQKWLPITVTSRLATSWKNPVRVCTPCALSLSALTGRSGRANWMG